MTARQTAMLPPAPPAPPGPGRPKDMTKRAAILDAARQMFTQCDFDGVSMDQIAAAAGVSKLTVYNHFGDKDALFTAVIRYYCDQSLPTTLFQPAAHIPLREVLLGNLANKVGQKGESRAASWHGCTDIRGWQALDRVLEVDQTPIGKTPRSCPATYIGFWDEVRKLFADTREARVRGWTASRFSFNTGAGRCPVCEGQGMRTIEMSFLPDVKVPCDACHGARFNPDTLAALLRGKSAGDVLRMEVDEAIPFFAAHPRILRPLQLMQDVGLGYLTLGQASPTLSGGEAQRIKLVTELSKARLDEGLHKTGRASRLPHTLYVLDEPTVGLSMADVEKLIHVLHRLVEAGNTVVVIEHNLDIIAEADWVLDLGPEGGDGGGQLVAQGAPEALTQLAHSHTGAALAPMLAA